MPGALARTLPRSLAHASVALLLGACAGHGALEQGQLPLQPGRPGEDRVRVEDAARLLPRRSGTASASASVPVPVPVPVLAPAPAPAPAPPTALAEALRKPVTLEFRDAPLRSVFDLIARSSGLNFVFDKDVRTDQKTSLFLKDSTVEAAVQRILLTNQLDQLVLDANTVLVYPATPAKRKDYQPLVVRAFYLVHADAKGVAAALKALTKPREIVVDEKLNLLIVRDTAESIRLAEKIVALHDLPEPEVMLEVEILEVKRTRLQDLGARWPDQLSLAPLATVPGAPLTLDDLRGLDGRSVGAALAPLTINARKTDSDTNILANPRIRARNREKARILIGERVPNITATSTSTGFVAESVTYVDVGLKLEVEPNVHLDGEVAIKVSLEVSNIINQLQTKSGSVAYQIGTRTAQTVLRLKDGENQVLAGLINDEDRRTANRLPGLGDVPVLGRLFGSQVDDRSKTEIVLSITPRVLRNVQRPAGPALEFVSGTESRAGAELAPSDARPAPAGAAPAQTASAPAAAREAVQPAAGAAPQTAPGAAVRAAAQPLAQPLAPSAGAGTGPPGEVHADPAPAAPAAAPASIGFGWQGPAQARVGELVSLALRLGPGAAVQNLPVTLGFDPRVLQLVSVQRGDLLERTADAGAGRASGTDGKGPAFSSRIDPAGKLLITATGASASPIAGPGTLAVISLRAISGAASQGRVSLLQAMPTGAGGQPVATTLPEAYTLRILTGAPTAP